MSVTLGQIVLGIILLGNTLSENGHLIFQAKTIAIAMRVVPQNGSEFVG